MQVIFDPNKSRSNVQKHGVTFDEAKIALLDEYALVREDFDHDEQRFVLLGMASRLLVVVYALIELDGDDEIIRIISARKATKKEETQYARGI